MEKKIYTAPQVEVIRFASEDVITTSGQITPAGPNNERPGEYHDVAIN